MDSHWTPHFSRAITHLVSLYKLPTLRQKVSSLSMQMPSLEKINDVTVPEQLFTMNSLSHITNYVTQRRPVIAKVRSLGLAG
jgi:hypothetical protein